MISLLNPEINRGGRAECSSQSMKRSTCQPFNSCSCVRALKLPSTMFSSFFQQTFDGAMGEAMERAAAKALLTTGGLGPTLEQPWEWRPQSAVF